MTTLCKVKTDRGEEVIPIEHHPWRTAIHEPRWCTSRQWLALLGLLCIGQGTASYWKDRTVEVM